MLGVDTQLAIGTQIYKESPKLIIHHSYYYPRWALLIDLQLLLQKLKSCHMPCSIKAHNACDALVMHHKLHIPLVSTSLY